MKLQSDRSGQVMLASAFIMAIVLAFIALMLNNLIYYNNISYTGFMNVGHDDLSIKNAVAYEAANAYRESEGNVVKFNEHMDYLEYSLNNVSLSEGSYVTISAPSFFESTYTAAPASPYHSTTFVITLSSKGSSKSYTIKTYHSAPVSTLAPTPAPAPSKCRVTISSPGNNSAIFQGGTNHTSLTVSVVDTTTNQPAINQKVILNFDSSIGWFYLDEARSTAVDQSIGVMTDDTYGQATVYWFPLTGAGAEGTDRITAQVGISPTLADQNLSNDVYFINKAFTPCTHAVTIGPLSREGNNNKDKIGGVWHYYVLIRVPVSVPAGDANFSGFSVGNVYNAAGSSNINPSYGNMGNYTETGYVLGSYTEYTIVKLYLIDRNLPFTVSLTTEIDGYCNKHYLPYHTSSTQTITGIWS